MKSFRGLALLGSILVMSAFFCQRDALASGYKDYSDIAFKDGVSFSEARSQMDSESLAKYLDVWRKSFQYVNNFDDYKFDNDISIYRVTLREHDNSKGDIVLLILLKLNYGWFKPTFTTPDSLIVKKSNGYECSIDNIINVIDKGLCINDDCTSKYGGTEMKMYHSFTLSKPLIYNDEDSALNKLSEALSYLPISRNSITYIIKDGVATMSAGAEVSEPDIKCRIAAMDLSTGNIKLHNDKYGCPSFP